MKFHIHVHVYNIYASWMGVIRECKKTILLFSMNMYITIGVRGECSCALSVNSGACKIEGECHNSLVPKYGHTL